MTANDQLDRPSKAVTTANVTDPELAALLDARKTVRLQGAYQPLALDDVRQSCANIVPLIGDGLALLDVARLGGGGSKEQFVLRVSDRAGTARKYVVRTDPLEAVTVSSRPREAEMIGLAGTRIPVPKVVFVDGDARYFPQPTLVMEFVEGVTKPATAGNAVTGLGISFGEKHRTRLAPQFVDYLARLHDITPSPEILSHHAIPSPNSRDAALWQLGYWAEIWSQDHIEPVPLVTYTQEWLRANAPTCERARMVHGDYRIGNFLFDEDSGRITSILDWELAHIGDYHEDVASVISPTMMVFDGVWRASDLFERDEWLDRYQEVSGLPIDPATLRYYEILSAYKTYITVAGTAVSVANASHSHQNILLTTLSGLAPGLLARICDLFENR